MKNKNLLYIGNNLFEKTNYATSMKLLCDLLEKENFVVYKSSDKANKILRLFDMCLSVFKNKKKVSYVLIDTFSTTNFYYALIISQLCRLLHLKYIPILRGGNLPYRLVNNPKISTLIFNHSHCNVAPSGYLKYEFEKQGFKTKIIPNIILIERYSYKERREIKPRLFYVRAFADIYNPKMAIDVLFELRKIRPNTILCMVGPDKGGTLKEVKELVNKLDITEHVEFTGVLSKELWHEKSKNFDVFINTTNVDNTPVSVIEAMALGLPIVSTNAGGMPFLVDHEVDGLLVDKGNVNQMVNAIESVLNGQHEALAKNARKKVEQFGWNVVRNAWIEILK